MTRIVMLAARALMAAGLAATATLVYAHRDAYRGIEALVAGQVSGLATGSTDAVNRDTSTYFVNIGTPDVFGVIVTPECSSAVATVVALAMAVLAFAVPRIPVRRALGAASVAATIFAAVNVLRLTMITTASDQWGLVDGHKWSHGFAGTLLTTAGGALAVVAFLLVVSGHGLRFAPAPAHRHRSS